MARRRNSDVAFLLVDGMNILGSITTLSDEMEAITEESHGFGDDWVEHELVGLKRATITQEGFYDDAAGSVNDALVSNAGVERSLVYGFSGNTVGAPVSAWAGMMQATYERVVSRGELHKANASYITGEATAVEDAEIVHILKAETADGDTESAPLVGDGSLDGGAAYLHVPALTLGGYTSLTVTVQHRSGVDAWATLATFTAVTAAPASQRIVVAGAVEDEISVAWEFDGAGSNPSAEFMVAFARY